MGLSRRRREASNMWPGFVDAVTTLLMVLLFVLTIFTVMQSVLRDQITTQTTELDQLNAQVSQLADALGLERTKVTDLTTQLGTLQSTLSAAKARGEAQDALIANLNSQLTARQGELSAAQTRIASFEAQVASLLADKSRAENRITDLTAANARLMSDQEALNLALAKARTEVDAQSEQARLAAARAEAIQALLDEMKARAETTSASLSRAQAQLTLAEQQRLVDAAALKALQDKLKGADDELTAMTLALEEQRRHAEETLKLLAAAEAAKQEATTLADDQKAALMAEADRIIGEKDRSLIKASERMALLNQQLNALRAQLAELQGVLNAAAAKDAVDRVQIESLGSQLNAALAQVAAEQKKRAELEAAEAARLKAENQDLSKYRSEFFGELSKLLEGQPGVRVVGDRFVFSSEVLFQPASADLSPEGQAQIASVVATLNQVVPQIPPSIPWIIRVDGHTDSTPLSGTGQFKDNWQLSQARALSVVRYMQDVLGFPPNRLAATGFGEYQPVATGDTPEALAQNRRIELKLTER